MVEISYGVMVLVISLLWLMTRTMICLYKKAIAWKRELQLLLVFICILVVVRITFCPFAKVDGKLQPLLFDRSQMWPPRINLIPLVHLFDYQSIKEAVLNFVGNAGMFIPIGIIFPYVYKELNTPVKVISAGIGFSLCIEMLQLPFFDRVTDVDDLILNTLGYVIGYLIYLLVTRRKNI